jgi:hypothetical protein
VNTAPTACNIKFSVQQFSAILLWIKYNDYSSVAEVWLLLIQVLIVYLGALAISQLLMPIALTLVDNQYFIFPYMP